MSFSPHSFSLSLTHSLTHTHTHTHAHTHTHSLSLSSRVLTTAVQFKPCFNFVRLLVLVLLVLVLLCFRFAPHNTYHITHAPFLPTGLLTEWRDIDNTSLTRDLIPGVSLLSSLARISCMFVPLLCSSVCCSSDFTLVPPMLSAADGWHHHAVRPTKSV